MLVFRFVHNYFLEACQFALTDSILLPQSFAWELALRSVQLCRRLSASFRINS